MQQYLVLRCIYSRFFCMRVLQIIICFVRVCVCVWHSRSVSITRVCMHGYMCVCVCVWVSVYIVYVYAYTMHCVCMHDVYMRVPSSAAPLCVVLKWVS